MHPCGLHFLLGKKGSGKSMIAVKMTIGVLIHTQRHIVTNLPLFTGELIDYIRNRYTWFDHTKIKNRITIISEAKILKRFWLTLGNDWWIPDVDKRNWDLGQRLDYRTAYRFLPTLGPVLIKNPIPDLSLEEIKYALNEQPPILESKPIADLPQVQFIIDEIQNIFPARSFLQTSPGALFFLSQQRHLGTDFIAISQNIDLVDKEFRDLADDFLYLTNWGRKQKSFFRLPKIITWSKYDIKPGPGISAMRHGALQVDVTGLGQLYDTSAGVGIEGSLDADKKEKVSGLHWGWFILLLILAAWLLLKVPGCLSTGILHFMRIKPSTTNLMDKATPKTNSSESSNLQNSSKNISPKQLTNHPIRNYDSLTGLTTVNGISTAWFKNGIAIKSVNLDRWEGLILREMKPVGVRIDGTNFYLPN